MYIIIIITLVYDITRLVALYTSPPRTYSILRLCIYIHNNILIYDDGRKNNAYV